MPWQAKADDTIPKGVVVKAVKTKADATQSYALYLPRAYSTTKTWPILICFDPLARGSVAVECFRDAAEQYGYIVVASNNSRNGPIEPSRLAAQAVLYDVVERFSIGRFYMAGFSGGARIACMLASLMGDRVAGVIGCAAGFPEDRPPSRETTFAFCGTVGVEDYNFTEMRVTDRKLAKLRLPHQILYFEGGHSWPPSAVATEAIEWLEIQAMKAGRRNYCPLLTRLVLDKSVRKAEAERATGSLLEAGRMYQRIAEAFEGVADIADATTKARLLVDVADAKTKAEALIKDKEARKLAKNEKDLEDRELAQQNEINRLIARLADIEERPEHLRVLRDLMTTLEGRAKDSESVENRLLARRLLNYIAITAFYAAEPLIDTKQYTLTILYQQLQADIQPGSASVQFRLARTYARGGDKNKALAALKRAAENGFANKARVDEDRSFDLLRAEPELLQTLAVMESNQQKTQ